MKFSYSVISKAQSLYDALGEEACIHCDTTICNILKQLERDPNRDERGVKDFYYKNIDFYIDVRLYIRLYKNRLWGFIA